MWLRLLVVWIFSVIGMNYNAKAWKPPSLFILRSNAIMAATKNSVPNAQTIGTSTIFYIHLLQNPLRNPWYKSQIKWILECKIQIDTLYRRQSKISNLRNIIYIKIMPHKSVNSVPVHDNVNNVVWSVVLHSAACACAKFILEGKNWTIHP